jgi:pimeloyl-ACP methyl ester carboxylesterase
MPAFLVHGVPDTHRLWDAMRAHLFRKDILAPDLPGFGADTPPGWVATKESYVDWLIGQLEKVGEAVDLVGHDWGSLLVQRAVSLRPDLIRTWACGNGPIDREYVWHDMAQQWQTPGVGEAMMEMMGGDAMIEGLVGSGVPADVAPEVVAQIDARMKTCILGLYRSAVKVGEEWEADVAKIRRPALVLWAREDPFVAPVFAERLAQRVRGRLHFLEGCGHFWPHERPAEAAAALEEFWAATSD